MKQTVGTIAKMDDDRRLVFGWAYITKTPEGEVIIDKQGDFVDDDQELEDAAYEFVKGEGLGDEMHLDVPVSHVVESVVFTPEKLEKMGLPPGSLPVGWWVGFQVDSDEVWGAVKNGVYKAFSIGGSGFREKVED
ncbi:Phage-like element PBSX protein, XkdF [uncultured Caudovirales phage]|jgi:hypothetical protein|uniref:Phage-like element PBSX protein, XkdF n=1 Tax=uncultured Caudovirales phage TaxID=2100421 RepID=A0A6J5R8L1_9CAUD|nr:Phage-like element PBSX protein, XkdF [uncultured Caudovirales phage]